MCDITVGVFEHIDITPKIDLDIRIKYTEHILRGPALKKFRQVLLKCKDPAKGLSGYQWSLALEKVLPCSSSVLGTRRMDVTGWDNPSLERNAKPTFRKSCGPSWEIACGLNTGQSLRIISIIPTLALCMPLG